MFQFNKICITKTEHWQWWMTNANCTDKMLDVCICTPILHIYHASLLQTKWDIMAKVFLLINLSHNLARELNEPGQHDKVLDMPHLEKGISILHWDHIRYHRHLRNKSTHHGKTCNLQLLQDILGMERIYRTRHILLTATNKINLLPFNQSFNF